MAEEGNTLLEDDADVAETAEAEDDFVAPVIETWQD